MTEEEIRDNLINAFKDLDIDTKRNEFNKELISLGVIINTYLKEFDSEDYPLPDNYIQGKNTSLTESELLDKNYIDLLDIKNRLVLLLKYIERN